MAEYHLRFSIPSQQQGERASYKAFGATLRQLQELMGKTPESDCRVTAVDVTGGSIRGTGTIDAPNYEEALAFACRSTPIIDLDWHLEERVDPNRIRQILEEAMK